MHTETHTQVYSNRDTRTITRKHACIKANTHAQNIHAHTEYTRTHTHTHARTHARERALARAYTHTHIDVYIYAYNYIYIYSMKCLMFYSLKLESVN